MSTRPLPLVAALAVLISSGQAVAQTYSYVECEARFTAPSGQPFPDGDVYRLNYRIGSDQLWVWTDVTWRTLCGPEGRTDSFDHVECQVDPAQVTFYETWNSSPGVVSRVDRTTINRRTGVYRREQAARFSDGSSFSYSEMQTQTGTCRATRNPETTAPPPLF